MLEESSRTRTCHGTFCEWWPAAIELAGTGHCAATPPGGGPGKSCPGWWWRSCVDGGAGKRPFRCRRSSGCRCRRPTLPRSAAAKKSSCSSPFQSRALDGTRPANVERLDILRFTGPAPRRPTPTLLKLGTKVASVPVKAPASPNITTEADEPAEEPELKDEGLDQGALALLEDTIGAAASKAVENPRRKAGRPPATGAGRVAAPLLGPPLLGWGRPHTSLSASIPRGVRDRCRAGCACRWCRRPQPPPATTITYDENTITVSWTPSASVVPIQAPATGDLLPGRTLGIETPTLSYHVYDVSPSAVAASTNGSLPQLSGQLRLTRAPVEEARYADSRIEWGSTRCYAVRTVETFGDLTHRKRSADARMPDAPGHVPADRAQGSAGHRDRPGDQPHLGSEQRKGRGRLPRVARDGGGRPPADHANADHRPPRSTTEWPPGRDIGTPCARSTGRAMSDPHRTPSRSWLADRMSGGAGGNHPRLRATTEIAEITRKNSRYARCAR